MTSWDWCMVEGGIRLFGACIMPYQVAPPAALAGYFLGAALDADDEAEPEGSA